MHSPNLPLKLVSHGFLQGFSFGGWLYKILICLWDTLDFCLHLKKRQDSANGWSNEKKKKKKKVWKHMQILNDSFAQGF